MVDVSFHCLTQTLDPVAQSSVLFRVFNGKSFFEVTIWLYTLCMLSFCSCMRSSRILVLSSGLTNRSLWRSWQNTRIAWFVLSRRHLIKISLLKILRLLSISILRTRSLRNRSAFAFLHSIIVTFVLWLNSSTSRWMLVSGMWAAAESVSIAL